MGSSFRSPTGCACLLGTLPLHRPALACVGQLDGVLLPVLLYSGVYVASLRSCPTLSFVASATGACLPNTLLSTSSCPYLRMASPSWVLLCDTFTALFGLRCSPVFPHGLPPIFIPPPSLVALLRLHLSDRVVANVHWFLAVFP